MRRSLYLSASMVLLLSLAACSSDDEPGKAANAPDVMAATPAASETSATSAQAPASSEQPAYGMGDAIDPATGYHATTILPCAIGEGAKMGECNAGVKRKWGEDGTHLVEITKPDGRKRAIFFRDTTPYGADSAQSDGSAGWDFKVERDDRDNSIVTYGPERYTIPDMLITGG